MNAPNAPNAHLKNFHRLFLNHPHLKESNEVAEHEAVEVREVVHYADGLVHVVVVVDALVVELGADERLVQLPVPQLQ